MNAMQPPQSIEEIKAGLETTEKGGVRQSIRNCLTVFQCDPLLSGAIAYNILTDRKDIIKPILKMTARCIPCCYPVAEPVAGENPETIGFSPL